MGTVIIFTVSFFGFCTSAFAAVPDYDAYDLQSYKSYLNQDGIEIIQSAINAMANLIFTLTKAIYVLADTAVEVFYGMDVINQFSSTISSTANELYNVLYSGLGLLIILITFCYIAWHYMTTQDISGSIRKLLCFILAVGVSVVWLPNTSAYLNKLNEVSMDIQSSVMSVGNEIDGIEGVRQAYFEVAIYEPYILMNYGTTDDMAINSENSTRSTTLLYTASEDSDDAEEENEDYIIANESENDYMSKGSVGYKFVIAVISFFVALLYGTLLIGASFLTFAVQVSILILALFLPVAIIISFLPNLWTSGFKVLGTIGVLFCIQIFVGFAVSGVFTLNNVIDELIVGSSADVTGAGEYMLEVLITFLIVALIVMKRDLIVSTVTGGALSKVQMPAMLNEGMQDSKYIGGKAGQGGKFVAKKGYQGAKELYEMYDDYMEQEMARQYEEDNRGEIIDPEPEMYRASDVSGEIAEKNVIDIEPESELYPESEIAGELGYSDVIYAEPTVDNFSENNVAENVEYEDVNEVVSDIEMPVEYENVTDVEPELEVPTVSDVVTDTEYEEVADVKPEVEMPVGSDAVGDIGYEDAPYDELEVGEPIESDVVESVENYGTTGVGSETETFVESEYKVQTENITLENYENGVVNTVESNSDFEKVRGEMITEIPQHDLQDLSGE